MKFAFYFFIIAQIINFSSVFAEKVIKDSSEFNSIKWEKIKKNKHKTLKKIIWKSYKGEENYFGENVSKKEHMIQCAVSAQEHMESEKVILACLLHDIGHGPLSHTSEAIFDHNHEKWSQNLVKNYSPINSILKKYDNDLPRQIAELYESKQLFSKPLKTLISSEIDCDRLDYLLRDSYNTGTKYGLVDLERIISALTFSPDGNIAIKPKGVIAIEHFLVLRNLMYRTIYNHRINEISTWILEKIIYTIKHNIEKKIWLDESLYKWIFSYSKVDFDDFMRNDDVTFYYHLMRWKEESFEPLSTLCKMFMDRNFLKASDVSFLNKIERLEILAFAKKLCETNNYDSEIFCGIKERSFRGFESYNALKIWDGTYQNSLENSSALIKTLMNTEESSYIIYPNIIKNEIKNKISNIRNNI